ncbi:MAG: hypothetical protein HC923_01790, partial [Myxococcales bacterium]|nr:hypothetical protein [Myxococcales bacterium]
PPGGASVQELRASAVSASPRDAKVLARFDPGPPSAASEAEDYDPGRRTMTYIGFRQTEEVSRVFVRLDGRARFRQYQEGSLFVLELTDTRVNVKNNERPLDTTYFDSPVLNVRAVSGARATRIEVKLRKSVPWQIKRIGTTIAVDFQHADGFASP